jgi:hypothetical protein
MARWTLTVRNGPRVERSRFETLPATLAALEQRLDELSPQARRDSVQVLRRRFDAARQVAVRGEVSGPERLVPSVRGGVDLRGDGSVEAYTGRWRRSLVPLQAGETAYDGLRRALGGDDGLRGAPGNRPP